MCVNKSRRVKDCHLMGTMLPRISSSASVVWDTFFLFSKSLVVVAESLRFLDLISGSYQRGAKSSSVKVLSCKGRRACKYPATNENNLLE